MLKTIDLKSARRIEFIDITDKINGLIRQSGMVEGVCFLSIPHTTAALTINENSDPDVVHDILSKTGKLIPQVEGYTHAEGNSDSHIKSSLFSPALSLIVNENRLLLGIWQAVYFCEFDGPRNRQVHIKLIPG